MEISHQQLNQRAFLGAALVDPAGAHEYILKLTPGMFDEGACRDTFAAIQRLTYAGEPVDPVTVVNMATSATLSADNLKRNIMQMAISIHALLAESDSKSAQNSGALLRI